jgi:hypothetical protein
MTMTRKTKSRSKLKPTRDNAVDEIREAVKALGLTPAEIYHSTYLSRGTISKLLESRSGKKRTRYPTFMTLKGVAAAGGMRYKLIREEGDT